MRVNQTDNYLNMEDPPLGLGGFDFDLLGDYMQVRASGSGDQTAAFVVWTGYDQYRSDDQVGSKKQRVYATRVLAPAVPGLSSVLGLGLAAAVAAAGAWALRRRRTSVAA